LKVENYREYTLEFENSGIRGFPNGNSRWPWSQWISPDSWDRRLYSVNFLLPCTV